MYYDFLTFTKVTKFSLSSGRPPLLAGNSQSKSNPLKSYFLKKVIICVIKSTVLFSSIQSIYKAYLH